MMRFLRKYSTWLLAVFGSLLMVVFLVPEAINQFAQRRARGGATWATIGPDDRSVNTSARDQAAQDVALLGRLGFGVRGLGPVEEPEHWYLLVKEAADAGLVAGRFSDESPAVATQLGLTGRGPAEETLAKLSGVNRLLGLWQSGSVLSNRRIETIARRLFHAASVRTVVLDARADADVPAPTAAEIQAHFDAYADVVPGEGDYGFGYRLPDRARVEVLHVTRAAIDAAVEARGAVDAVSLARHWKSVGGTKGLPAYDRGAAVPASIEQDLRATLAEELRSEIGKQIEQLLPERRQRLRTTLEGYVDLPEDWASTQVAFGSLAASLQEELPNLPAPQVLDTGTELLAPGELMDAGLPATAWTEQYGPRRTLADLVASVKEFGGDPRVLVQEDLVGPVLRTSEGGVVAFRVTDTDAARPPASIAETDGAVERDLRRKAHYDRLRADADALATTARNEGLLALALDRDDVVHGPLSVSLHNPMLFRFQVQQAGIDAFRDDFVPQAFPSTLPEIGSNEEAILAIIDHALAQPVTTPASDLPAEQRVFAVPVDGAMAVMVVELLAQTPLDRETFRDLAMLPPFMRLVARDDLGEILEPLQESFSYEALAERHRFVLRAVRDETDPAELPLEDEETVDESATAAASS